MKDPINPWPEHISGDIEMALSDHVSFAGIKAEHGLGDKHVKSLMRRALKSSSYRSWRQGIRDYGDCREVHK